MTQILHVLHFISINVCERFRINKNVNKTKKYKKLKKKLSNKSKRKAKENQPSISYYTSQTDDFKLVKELLFKIFAKKIYL